MMADLSIGSRPDRRIRLQSVHVFAVAAAGALAAQRDGLFVVCWSVVYGLTHVRRVAFLSRVLTSIH